MGVGKVLESTEFPIPSFEILSSFVPKSVYYNFLGRIWVPKNFAQATP